MILIDSLLANGVRFVLSTLAQAAQAEDKEDAEALRDELLRAQMSLELGEIDEEEFQAIEDDVSARLRAVRARESESGAEETRIQGVEVTLHADVDGR